MTRRSATSRVLPSMIGRMAYVVAVLAVLVATVGATAWAVTAPRKDKSS